MNIRLPSLFVYKWGFSYTRVTSTLVYVIQPKTIYLTQSKSNVDVKNALIQVVVVA